MMTMRETSWRVFSTELNASTIEIKPTEEMSPSYVVSPLGAKINRAIVAGILTEKENVGTPDEPMWRGRIQDVNGNFFFSIGRYQPEATAAIANLETPCFVAAVGRIRAYDNGERVYVNIRPDHIVEIDEEKRNEWLLETVKSTWTRLTNTKKALNAGNTSVNDLIAMGMTSFDAENLAYALDNYEEMPDSTVYLKTIQNALKTILPDKGIDFGFSEDIPDEPAMPESNQAQASSNGSDVAQLEDVILDLLDELDVDGKGAPREELEARAEAAGIDSIMLEEITMSLMDKGLVYEPNLKCLKRI